MEKTLEEQIAEINGLIEELNERVGYDDDMGKLDPNVWIESRDRWVSSSLDC